MVNGSEKDIEIDVRKSASHFEKPSNELVSVLREVLNCPEFGISSVVEFGAGKFRNVNFILSQGKTVCAVEFDQDKPCARAIPADSSSFRLMAPDAFSSDPQKFDLALLINVVPVMPLLSERMSAVNQLHWKINEGKYLLWFAQREGAEYKKIREKGSNSCRDGVWLGAGRRFKTFYKYHPLHEVGAIMRSAGFSQTKRFSGIWNDAALFRRE
jgi:hypothetical protein